MCILQFWMGRCWVITVTAQLPEFERKVAKHRLRDEIESILARDLVLTDVVGSTASYLFPRDLMVSY